MSTVNSNDIVQELILHEILGFTSGGGGGGSSFNLITEDNNVFVASGVDTLNFSTGIQIVDGPLNQVDISLKDIQLVNDILWTYDTTRTKWLSVQRINFSAGEKGRIKNKYLPVYDGLVSSLTGWRVPRDGVITAMSVQTRANESWTLHIRKNGVATNIASLVLANVDGSHEISTDVNIAAGDRIQFYAETTTFLGIKDVLAWIEISWRNDAL